MKPGPDGGVSRLETELDRHWLNWTLVAWLAVCTFFIWQKQGVILSLGLGDTDDNMRLMQVRALLAGQGWYDLTNYRLDPALGGLNIHWSRLCDLPIAGLILLFKPFIGVAAAEKWACGIAPMLPLGVTLTGLSLTVRRLIDPRAWPVAVVVLLTSCTLTMSMYMPMRIDHHGWQIAALAMTVAGLADPGRARGGAVVGISSAFSLTIGLEMLPYCAMAGAIIGLRWVWDRGEARRMQIYAVTLAGVSALGFALFTSNANMAMRCDALTPVWLSTVTVAGALLFILSLVNPQERWMRLAMGAAAGAAIAAGFALLFPQCLGRPEGVSPELARIWLNNVREARPIYRLSWDNQLTTAAMPVIGLIGSAVAAWRARGTDRAVGWATIALFTAFSGATLLWQVRTGPAAQMLGVPGSTALIWLIVPWCLSSRQMLMRVVGSVAAFLVVSGLFAGFVVKWMPRAPAASGGGTSSNRAYGACTSLAALRQLDAIPAATMFTHVDMGPRLVTLTHHDGVAGPYHRNERAILDVHHAFMGSAAQFRPIAKAHGAAYLLTCPNMAETTLYTARSKNGFYAQLRDGRIPKWLTPVALPATSPFKLWRIDYAAPDEAVRAPAGERHQPAPPPGHP
ncbi:AcrB/AcrD/AcrF family protein [Sphingomonas sp. LB-2]|uniref:AcrB/AcrD/AcrF family protein n=1 Tax=Sphingomonas caeni TaxID=2984949 RepID=UPI00222F3062|nr:AcrB/AcrD/AcrF family protein [Sphingomonas caeni]MCW3846345.1 AcrB/AcrD/AcrF family protein [Sphingomonas caeni]